jgi:hypothetical protein
VTNNSGLLPDELSCGENGEIWYPTYRKSCRELLIPISVDLNDDGLPRHVLCRASHFWGSGAARTAPISPEIDQDGDARVLDDLVEQRRIHLQRFVQRRQGRFACTATASIRQVGRRDAVLLATGFAGSYHRHRFSPFALDSSCGLRLRRPSQLGSCMADSIRGV